MRVLSEIANLSPAPKLLKKWEGVCAFSGITNPLLVRRYIAYYGFPKPRKLKMFQRSKDGKGHCAITNVWFEHEVTAWLEQRKAGK